MKQPDGGHVRVAVCQILCIDSDRGGNLCRIEHALEDASEQGAQLACFPETCLLGWVNPRAHDLAEPIPGPAVARLGELAKQHGLMIAIGLAEKSEDGLYDSAVLIGADGKLLARHRKINTLTELMDPPYARGRIEEITAADTPIGRVCLLICADVFREDLVAAAAEQKPDLLVIPFGWAAEPDEWPHHGRTLRDWVSRTAKTVRCPVVGTDLVGAISTGPWRGKTYGGQSPVAGADGEILGVLRDREAEVRVFELRLPTRAPGP